MIKQEYLNRIKELIKDRTYSKKNLPRQTELWMIKYEGEFISLLNGKDHWAKLQHAKSALTDKIKSSFDRFLWNKNIKNKEADEIYKEIINALVESGELEFVRIL